MDSRGSNGKWLVGLIAVSILVLAGLLQARGSIAQESPWLHGPPGGISVTRCPDPGQWLLLYWGAPPASIAEAALGCPNADRFWMRRGTVWLGFYPALPQASDNWIVQTGEASFVHGAVPAAGDAAAGAVSAGSDLRAPATPRPATPAVVFSPTPLSTGTPRPADGSIATMSPPAAAAVGPSATPSPLSPGPYAVSRVTAYRTALGTLHIVGEARNNSLTAVEHLQVRATLYDAMNNVIGTGEAFACLGVVPPAGESPFDLLFFDPPSAFVRYTLEVRARATTREPPVGLDVTAVNVARGAADVYRVSGEVVNNSRQTYRLVQVCGAFYDVNGNVVRVDSSFTSPSTLGPRERGSFTLAQQGANIDIYRIWTDGQP